MSQGLFVAGTDTGVGKSRVASALLHAYARQGLRCVGMKPVAAGAEWINDQWQNEDVAMLLAASNVDAPAEWRNPFLFREAIAPHIAAEHKGVRIDLPKISSAYAGLAGLSDVVVVEGVGGFRVPLTAERDTADLAVALNLPIVLVVGMRLGCLNHALLTVEAITQRNLRLAGWVANQLSPGMPAYAENLSALQHRLPAPLLAEFPFNEVATGEHEAGYFSPRRLHELLSQQVI